MNKKSAIDLMIDESAEKTQKMYGEIVQLISANNYPPISVVLACLSLAAQFPDENRKHLHAILDQFLDIFAKIKEEDNAKSTQGS